ncbi:MAG: hypothetical protein AAGB93_20175 [Planctomycetota bacterium]
MNDPNARNIGVLPAAAIALGVNGMWISFQFLCTNTLENLVSGAAGFVAGSILVGTGVVSHALTNGARHPTSETA